MGKVELPYKPEEVPETTEFGLVEVTGRYLMEVVKVQDQEAKEGKAASTFILAIVVGSESEDGAAYVGNGDDVKPARVPINITHHPNAAWKMMQFQEATFLRRLEQSFDTDEFLGKRFVGFVKVGEYQGKKRNECDNFYPPSEFKSWDGKSASDIAASDGVPWDEPAAPSASGDDGEEVDI